METCNPPVSISQVFNFMKTLLLWPQHCIQLQFSVEVLHSLSRAVLWWELTAARICWVRIAGWPKYLKVPSLIWRLLLETEGTESKNSWLPLDLWNCCEPPPPLDCDAAKRVPWLWWAIIRSETSSWSLPSWVPGRPKVPTLQAFTARWRVLFRSKTFHDPGGFSILWEKWH